MKTLLIAVGLALTSNHLAGQSIMIGSGLFGDTLLVTNFGDTLFHNTVTSNDEVDLFVSIPVKRVDSKFSFYINGKFVSSIYMPKPVFKKHTRLYVDFSSYRKQMPNLDHQVEYRIIDKK